LIKGVKRIFLLIKENSSNKIQLKNLLFLFKHFKKLIMKRFFALATVSVALISLSSCSKDYTCECKITIDGVQTNSSTTTITGKKKDAKESCENGTNSQTVGGITQTITCGIKD
jgi:hypothetical protein